ncbi:MAG: hypothetical protein ABR568_00740 [Pyrinomonadaceae bacterium]
MNLPRIDYLGKEGYLQRERESQRKELEAELTALQAKIANAEASVPVPAQQSSLAEAAM